MGTSRTLTRCAALLAVTLSVAHSSGRCLGPEPRPAPATTACTGSRHHRPWTLPEFRPPAIRHNRCRCPRSPWEATRWWLRSDRRGQHRSVPDDVSAKPGWLPTSIRATSSLHETPGGTARKHHQVLVAMQSLNELPINKLVREPRTMPTPRSTASGSMPGAATRSTICCTGC